MDPITALTLALAQGLVEVGTRVVTKGVVEAGQEPAIERLEKWVQRPYRRAEKDQALRKAVQDALEEAGAPADDSDALLRWLKLVGLDRLTAEKNAALRRQVARGVLAGADPAADPPADLVTALGWPRSRQGELAALLAAIRAKLAALADWQVPIEYADRAAERGLLKDMLERLARLDNVFLQTEAGAALRVAVVDAGLSEAEAAVIEARYRADLVRELELHDFRGIVQIKRDLRLPLADIYVELGLLRLGTEEERRRAHEELLALREAERLAQEERRLQERVTDALAESPRLAILGEPGSGKTISLRFIALMLAHGYGAARLGLDVPYIPLMVRLADYARALEKDPALSLGNYLLDYIGRAYECHPRLADFLRLVLDKGAGLVLLDGLDEVGDDPVQGRSLRTRVVEQVQRFADKWCHGQPCNRVVVTSRIEGYWDEPVRGFDHVQISPLRPPDEVEAFLLRWYTAHEQAHGAPPERAERRARERVGELLPHITASPSVRRLATNPLLLTILALIHENVGKLPNRRIKLYEICAQTLIESWRQSQTGRPTALLAELEEETVIRVLAPLAYWLHEEHPGGAAAYEDWQARLTAELEEVLEDEHRPQAHEIAGRFLHHARHEVGLLAERGLGQFGFFHLTFEEYLAAREIARQRAEERRALLRAHWEDPRWHEVILLTAGQLGIAEARQDDASDFLEDLLKMETDDPGNAGRQAVLAGRALADIGPRSVTKQTRLWVQDALVQTMQDRDPETGHLCDPPCLPARTRYDAGAALDELGWLPDDLDVWVSCPGCAEDGRDLFVMKYPLTNAQYERFIQAGGYENPAWWSEEGWQWRVGDHPSYRGEGPVAEPWFWRDPRFGQERRGYPVVGVSWYEAQAYCRWLTDQLRVAGSEFRVWHNGQLETRHPSLKTLAVRLPTEREWEALAGGVRDKDRYPWDPPRGPATRDKAAILSRANTYEAQLGGTSPAAMYPLGASQPHGLMDLAGNVWERTASEYEGEKGRRVLRGGSWLNEQDDARCAYRGRYNPASSNNDLGFRCVAPIFSYPGF